jgi:propanol-preferring alcohol dehydrogenase
MTLSSVFVAAMATIVFGGRSIYGALTGTPIDNEDTLAFSVLENIRPMIETVPLEQAADAYARMMQGNARFRMVLTMNARGDTG